MLDWIRRGEGPWRGLGIAAALLVFLAWLGGAFGPQNYHECVLQHSDGLNSRFGAGMIHDACAAKFGAPSPAR